MKYIEGWNNRDNMKQEQVIEELKALVQEGNDNILPTRYYPEGFAIAHYYVESSQYAGWFARSLSFLKMILSPDSDFIHKFSALEKHYYSNAKESVSILEGVVEYIEKGFISTSNTETFDANVELKRIFSKFHRVVRQVRNRYNDRSTIDVNDEYDVQDLLHALLRLYFDDIRSEEWTPSYAGKSARMDFLLKNEKIVIEVKKTRQGLTDRELGDQLIIDVDRYKVHPDCEKLICFVYDPEGRIGNPAGVMNDLNMQHEGFVEVIIEPVD